MNKLPIIQSLWIGKELSVMEELCISSFLQNGHPFHLYVYDDVKNIPDQTILKDASEILGPARIFKYKDHDSYGGFANLFRYKLLLEKGNYWVDTDIICLKPFLHEAEYVFAGERQLDPETNSPSTSRLKAANCVIKTPSGSSIMDYCYRESNNKDPQSLHWGQTGPQLLTKAINHFDLWSYVADSEVFCPINWWQWSQFITERPDNNELKNAQSIHLWNEMWRRNNIDKSDNFDSNSIYEQLKKTYLKK